MQSVNFKITVFVFMTFITACGINRPDTHKKESLKAAYEICFSTVESDIGVDLRTQKTSWRGELAHYNLARERLIAAVNAA